MKIIFKTIAGSRLYGLETETSDWDYKSVFIPSFRDLILEGPLQHNTSGTASKGVKNTAADTDTENMSVAKFILMAAKLRTIRSCGP